MRIAAALACAVLLICVGVLPSRAEKRVALVIGNDSYANLPADEQLRKAVNDARAVGDALSSIGFQVIRGENLGRQALLAKFDELTQRLEPGDTAFFFFAGHGVAVGGGNYILPADAPNVGPGQDMLLARASLGETDIVGDLQARGVRVAVVVLDACRNNPFKKPGVRGVGAERGLGRIEPVRGVFTLYSAGIGQTALDRLGDTDRNPNSVFTRVFVPSLGRPGVDLKELAGDVREEVARLAASVQHDQRPAYYDETIGGRVYLAGLPKDGEVKPPIAPPPVGDPAASAWATVKDTTSVPLLEAFIKRYGDSFYADVARARLDDLKRVAVVAPPVAPAVPAGPCGTGAQTVSFTSRPACPLSAAEERGLKPKDLFKECDKCPEMVGVPSGSFTMGSPASEAGRSDNEGPQHSVTISRPFAVGRFAVTFDEWDACVADGGCNGYKPADRWGRGRQPLINVSWDDAKTYVAWLSRKTGKGYRLLSEAEREYATRAGTTTPFWWGSSISTSQANYDGTHTYGSGSKGEYPDKTVPVSSFQPNAWGLYQVHGNVYDWVEDCYHEGYTGAPSDGSAWVSGDCSRRVLRGGSWVSDPKYLRAAYRGENNTTDFRNTIKGFRVARTLTP
jgi:formylglycine-generating enzyme required for sulfatase activity